MEWGHRILGRLIGVVFVGPLIYFAGRNKISGAMVAKMSGLAALIGVQGFLGWYMVQSGLEDSIMNTPGAVPRVSQYRLAAHLGTAIALYAGMFGAGMAAIKDWKFSKGADWSGVKGISSFQSILNNSTVRAFKVQAWAITGLMFLTALSGEDVSYHPGTSRIIIIGAFVAGLDAGLLYNEFPLMGGRLAPPSDELFSPSYAKNADNSDLWRNIFENPTTVQFDHRVLVRRSYLGYYKHQSNIILGHDHISWYSVALRADVPPRIACCVTPSDPHGSYCCLCHGQPASPPWNFDAIVPRSCPIGCSSSSRKCHAPQCHDTYPCHIAKTRSGCTIVETSKFSCGKID